MKKLLLYITLQSMVLMACGHEDEKKSSEPVVAEDEPVSEEVIAEEEEATPEVEAGPTYEKPNVVAVAPVTIVPPVPGTPPVAEDPIIAQKIAEMDALIEARVNLLMAWNVWDDYRDKALVNESPSRQTPAHYFQLHSSHPFMKANGVFGQEDTFIDNYYSWWLGKKVNHCGELVDSTDSELFVEYTGRDTTERSKLYIQIYFYTPVNNGPIYITKIKLNWKFSNGVEQESLRQASCQ